MISPGTEVDVDVDMGRPDCSRTVHGKVDGYYHGKPDEPIELRVTSRAGRAIIPASRIITVWTTE